MLGALSEEIAHNLNVPYIYDQMLCGPTLGIVVCLCASAGLHRLRSVAVVFSGTTVGHVDFTAYDTHDGRGQGMTIITIITLALV